MKKNCLIVLIVCLLLLTGCQLVKGQESWVEDSGEAEPPVEIAEEAEPSFETLVISGAGDIMVHGPQLTAQYQPETREYDFSNNFQYMKPLIEKADIAIANLETTFGGQERGYSSFPRFNTPDSMADALVYAGFDTISTSNNHTFDTGIEGIKRTLSVLHDRGLRTVGTRSGSQEQSYLIVEEKGIKVGLTAFTYETPRLGEHRTLNALKIPKEAEPLIDSFGYEYLEEDLEIIRQRIEQMRASGAEIIVFYIHWGEEYQREPNEYQRKIAQTLSNYGVDIIFGSHPHVLQPVEIIDSETDSRQTLVVYSMGNFLSNQRYEILKNPYTEDGLMVEVTMKKNLKTKEIVIDTVGCIPTWVHRYYINKKGYYEIVPVMEAVERPEEFNLFSEDSRRRSEKSRENSLSILKTEEPRVRIKSLNQ